MAFDPWTNPPGSHVGPWTFEQALACLMGGGRVRRTIWQPGVYLFIAAGEVRMFDPNRPREWFQTCIEGKHFLATDWHSVSAPTPEGG
jgi:hypothetical protein